MGLESLRRMIDENPLSFPLPSGPRKSRRIFLIALFCIVVASFLRFGYGTPYIKILPESHKVPKEYSKAFVVASRQEENTTWIGEHFPEWPIRRYIVDNSSAEYTVPKNKGREAMVYLTYIIDHYDSLPDISLFIHSQRYQWHNDDPLYDGVPMLRNLQIPYLASQGYTNLRCVWTLGCPSELILDGTRPLDSNHATESAYLPAFAELFPELPLPTLIAVPCCAQFSLTRSAIHLKPLSSYIHYRTWLLETELEDAVSGRILEYAWHIIFGKEEVHCPDVQTCYCKLYGLCGLECDEEGRCGERWPFPPSASLPYGWPTMGWDGEKRTEEDLEKLKNTGLEGRAGIEKDASAFE